MLKVLSILSLNKTLHCKCYQPLLYNCDGMPKVKRFYSSKKDKKKKGNAHLSDEIVSEIIDISQYKLNLESVINSLNKKFSTVITIERSAGSLNNIQIEKEKKMVQLNEIARIHMKSPELYIINLTFNPELIPRIEKALALSGMNFGIQKEGNTIYVSIPKITREYKENLVKSARILAQKAKEQIKEAQNELIKDITSKEELFSHDIIYGAKSKVQDIAKIYSSKIEDMTEIKKKELLVEL